MGLQPVVEDDSRLMPADHLHQLTRFPFLTTVVVEGVVKPHDVEFAILGNQFFHLSVHVLQVVVPVEILLGVLLVIALGVVPHIGIVGVVPVDDGIVESYFQPFSTEGVEEFPDQVAAPESGSQFIIGELAVKEAVAIMVLGRENGILHAGGLGQPCPFPCVKLPGMKGIYVLLVSLGGDTLIGLYPFPPRRHGIRPEMDEHPKPGLPPPLGPLHHLIVVFKVCFRGLLLGYHLPSRGGQQN